jgi:hypothetical protein
MKSKKEKLAELRGVGKILDILWTNSYYSMGEKASKRIEEEMIYYFGKNWPKDMYDFIQDDKPRCQPLAVETLKQLK